MTIFRSSQHRRDWLGRFKEMNDGDELFVGDAAVEYYAGENYSDDRGSYVVSGYHVDTAEEALNAAEQLNKPYVLEAVEILNNGNEYGVADRMYGEEAEGPPKPWKRGEWGKGTSGPGKHGIKAWVVKGGNPHHGEVGNEGDVGIWIAPDGTFTDAVWINYAYMGGMIPDYDVQDLTSQFNKSPGGELWSEDTKYLKWMDPAEWVVKYWGPQGHGYGHAAKVANLSLPIIFNWDPREHPRNILGRFRQKVNNLDVGDAIKTRNGVKLTRFGDRNYKVTYGNIRYDFTITEQDPVTRDDMIKDAIQLEDKLRREPEYVKARSILLERGGDIFNSDRMDYGREPRDTDPEIMAENGEQWKPGYWGKGFIATKLDPPYETKVETWPVNKNGNPHHGGMFYTRMEGAGDGMDQSASDVWDVDYETSIWIAPDGKFTSANWINRIAPPRQPRPGEMYVPVYESENWIRPDFKKYFKWMPPAQWVATYWADPRNRGFGHARNLDQDTERELLELLNLEQSADEIALLLSASDPTL